VGFVSSYQMVNNVREVYVLESYRMVKYPLNEFETFKKVINPSADFNTIVLVLEKKG
jgi:hypothetical protein